MASISKNALPFALPLLMIGCSAAGVFLSMKTTPQLVVLALLAAYLMLDRLLHHKMTKYAACLLIVVSTFAAAIFVALQVLSRPVGPHPAMPIGPLIAGTIVGLVLSPLLCFVYVRWIRASARTEYAWIAILTALLMVVFVLDKIVNVV